MTESNIDVTFEYNENRELEYIVLQNEGKQFRITWEDYEFIDTIVDRFVVTKTVTKRYVKE